MGESLGLIAAIALELAVLLRLGLWTRGVIGALLSLQALYLALGYVARPLLVIWTTPAPRPDDPFADPRLASMTYERGVTTVLWPAVIGLGLYVVLMWLWLHRRRGPQRPLGLRVRAGHAMTLLAVGWVFRGLALASGGSFLDTLALTGSLASGVAALYSPRLRFGLVVFLLASELAWSIATVTKTPILALALWFLIRHLAAGGRMSGRATGWVAAVALTAFYVLQEAKERAGLLVGVDRIAERYPPVVQPFLTLLARFDALQALTDAAMARPGSWLSPAEAMAHAARALVPRQLLNEKADPVGALWGLEVRSQSLPGEPGANLAEGPVAEGWVLGGHLGVAVEVTVLAFLVILVARLLADRRLFWTVLGLAMTSQPFLFERGLVGAAEGLGKGLQVTVVAVLVLGFLRLDPYRRERQRQEPQGATQTSKIAGVGLVNVPA